MASSATTRLKLEKQADGENDSTWGQKANTVFDLVDEAMEGYYAVDVSGTADVNLTSTNYTSDEARQRVLHLSGTVSASIQVIAPNVEKWYIIDSAWSGSGAVELQCSGGASGSGVTIAQGHKYIVFSDGTNFTEVISTNLSAASALQNLVEDTTPQLGGDLDANGNNIKLDTATGLQDDSGNWYIRFTADASPVNYLDVANADDGADVTLQASGSSSNIDLSFVPKGSGEINANATIRMGDNVLDRAVLQDCANQGKAHGTTSGSVVFHHTSGSYHTITAGGDISASFDSWPASGDGGVILVEITNGGAHTISWASAVKFPGSTAPTLTTSGTDIVLAVTADGGTNEFANTFGLDLS